MSRRNCCRDSSTSGSICKRCVSPMRDVLAQLPVGTRITLGTLDASSGNLQNVDLQSVADFMIFVKKGNKEIAVPICKVTGVAGKGSPNVIGTPAYLIKTVLLSYPKDDLGEGACCEDPVRRFLQGINKADIDVLGPAFNNIQNASILQVGEGIVKIQAQDLNVATISISQISLITNFN